MCNGCAMNFALSELGKTRKKFVFLGKGMVRPGGFELPTFWFVARRSIQLSYGRTEFNHFSTAPMRASRLDATSRGASEAVRGLRRAALSG